MVQAAKLRHGVRDWSSENNWNDDRAERIFYAAGFDKIILLAWEPVSSSDLKAPYPHTCILSNTAIVTGDLPLEKNQQKYFWN